MQNLSGELRFDNLVYPQNAAGGTVVTNSSGYKSMVKYRKGLVVVVARLTDTKTCVAALTCADTAAGGNVAAVTNYSITLTGATAVTLSPVGVIPFDVSALDLANNKWFVGCNLTSNQSGDIVSAVLVRGAARFFEGGVGTGSGMNSAGTQSMNAT